MSAFNDLAWPGFCHPLDLSQYFTKMPLYEWQADTLRAAAIPHSRVVVSTPNEAGKTSVLGVVFILSAMCAFPGAHCFATSGAERQIKEQFFEQNIVSIVKHFPGWKVLHGDMKVVASNGSTLLCYVCRDELKVEGFHGRVNTKTGKYEPCVYYMDECKSISGKVHDAVRRINPDFLLATSTPPTEGTGWFYRAIGPEELRAREARK